MVTAQTTPHRRPADTDQPRDSWTARDAAELYGVDTWGRDFFSVSADGSLMVHPTGDPATAIDLKQLVDEIEARGIGAPLLIRFPEILRRRLEDLNACFTAAIREMEYRGAYRGVYPIKVNQERQVVEAIVEFGRSYHFGLEAGSKPELLAVLALSDTIDGLIICNGYKDREYIELALLGTKLGRQIVIVLEMFGELDLVLSLADRHRVRPILGVRSKLNARGTGRWESAGDQASKFGLTAGEMLRVVDVLRERDMLDCLGLLHFHIGSQVSDISRMKAALQEGARFYVELRALGAGLKFFDVGGGLAVDYDGSQTNFGASMNYSLQEYANDVVFQVMEVCDDAGVEHPVLISESGRALTAHHSVLIVNILDVSTVDAVPDGPNEVGGSAADDPNVLRNLLETHQTVNRENFREAYHDAIQYRDEAITLFNLGYLSLAQRAIAERLFGSICQSVLEIVRALPAVPEDFERLEPDLASTYFGNFSLFQSLPDSWAMNHLFPVMPIHRLNERPTARGILADVTCDADGCVRDFIDIEDVKKVLELHPPNGEPYYVGIFLVGAYQEILGDLHNLFGDTNAVMVSTEPGGGTRVEHVDPGDTVEDVLRYVSYDRSDLIHRLRASAEAAVRRGTMSVNELREFITMVQRGMDGYTYLV